MRYMNGKARMMVAGIALGAAGVGIMAFLISSGRLGVMGFLAVILLAALAGFSGWLMGVQERIRIDRDRAWMQGYKQGREEGQIIAEVRCIHVNPFSMGMGR